MLNKRSEGIPAAFLFMDDYQLHNDLNKKGILFP